MASETSNSGDSKPLPEIAGFRLQRVLGHGGMSTVYLARQASLEREVALKVMLPEALTDEISRRRFENEARTIARLDHPNIVHIFEVGRSRDGLPYYAMPYLPRGHLGQRGFAHEQVRVRSILHSLLSALEYAHSRGVVHRDVKAENVLFDDAERPLLADFGIALRRGYGTRVTTAGLAVGSTAYMPPEQARGHNVDGRADLYSVGVLGWEMLTGRLPYNAGDALSMALQHAQEPIPRLPPELRQWQKFFDKALSKSPDTRFATSRDMRVALDKVPERASRPLFGRARSAAATPGASRKPLFSLGAAALLVLVAIGIGWHTLRSPRVEEFYRVPATGEALPAPDPDASARGVFAQAADAADSLLRPLPESAGEPAVTAAETQLRQQRLITPRGDNAYESLMTAVEADAAHPRLVATGVALVDALAEQSVRALRQDDTPAALDAVDHALRVGVRIALPRRTRTGKPDAIVRMNAGLSKALAARIEVDQGKFDRDAAVRTADIAKVLHLEPAQRSTLLRMAQAVPVAGAPLPTEPGWTLMRAGNGHAAIANGSVTRADYAHFAEATKRTDARCRERASLLRIVAPRDWKSPGFAQTPQQPVVCVSWQDASAYTRWLGAQRGKRYRLATPAELQAAPAATDGKVVALWVDTCGDTCARRQTAGRGWRRNAGGKPLESDRGFDDVGFRLVQEL